MEFQKLRDLKSSGISPPSQRQDCGPDDLRPGHGWQGPGPALQGGVWVHHLPCSWGQRRPCSLHRPAGAWPRPSKRAPPSWESPSPPLPSQRAPPLQPRAQRGH